MNAAIIIKTKFMAHTQIDSNRKIPLWFSLTLIMIVIAAIVVYFTTQNDGRTDQINIEKKTTQLDYTSDRRIA